jgi:hypothetical protein
MDAPTYDQLEALAGIAGRAGLGHYGTTFEIHAEPVTCLQVRVMARDENELHSSGELVTHTILLDGSGRARS